MDVNIPVFSALSAAKKTIINQINIANENHEDAIYYDDNGYELDGAELI